MDAHKSIARKYTRIVQYTICAEKGTKRINIGFSKKHHSVCTLIVDN